MNGGVLQTRAQIGERVKVESRVSRPGWSRTHILILRINIQAKTLSAFHCRCQLPRRRSVGRQSTLRIWLVCHLHLQIANSPFSQKPFLLRSLLFRSLQMGDYNDALMRNNNAAVQARTKAQNRANVLQLKLVTSIIICLMIVNSRAFVN